MLTKAMKIACVCQSSIVFVELLTSCWSCCRASGECSAPLASSVSARYDTKPTLQTQMAANEPAAGCNRTATLHYPRSCLQNPQCSKM